MDDRAELIRQIKKIDIATGVLVEGLQTGFHHSVFKGQGIEFTEIREYTPGDDIRAIDWKVTARYNRPFVKEFTEERDQTFYFVADISGSSGFGLHSTKKRKILEITASLAFAAVRNNDRVGLVLFSDRVEKFVPAKRGRKHLAELFNVMIDHRPVSKKTDLAAALQFLATVIARRSSIVILSDFASPSFSLTSARAAAPARSDRDPYYRSARAGPAGRGFHRTRGHRNRRTGPCRYLGPGVPAAVPRAGGWI